MRKELSKSDSAVVASQYHNESEYWMKILDKDLEPITFPYDFKVEGDSHSSDEVNSDWLYQYETWDFSFSAEVSAKLLKLSNNSNIRLHIVLSSLVTALLYKYTGQKDITIGSSVLKQQENVKFINTVLPLRICLVPNGSFRDLLEQVKKTISDATKHQNYPIEMLPYRFKKPFLVNGTFLLFDVYVLLENIHDQKYIKNIPVNIVFSFSTDGNHIKGKVYYNKNRYKEDTISILIGYLSRFAEKAITDFNCPINRIGIHSPEQLQQLLVEFNNSYSEYPAKTPVHRLFEARSIERFGQIAIKQEGKQWTYQQLNSKANQLAWTLQKMGIKEESIIAIMLDNSIEAVAAILAVLKAGGAYLPIEPFLPHARKEFIIRDSRAKVLLTQQGLLPKNQPLAALFRDNTIFCVDDDNNYNREEANLEVWIQSGHLAYVIYTSGTTGKPKGAMIDHRGLSNYIYWANKMYGQNELLDFPLYSNLSFDLTVTSIFTPLISGGAVVVYSANDTNPAAGKERLIPRIIRDDNVEIVKLTPSHLKLLRGNRFKNRFLKRFIVGGEALESGLASEIETCFNRNIEIFNEYGPTEATVGCMIHKFDSRTDTQTTIPIGTPADNVQIYILDVYLNPVPIGVSGEIYISGDGVARGYLNRPQLTKEKFIANPFIPGRRMYRTGDLARFLENGKIQFAGRIDHQVKIRGHRIELSEISNTIKTFRLSPPITTILSDNLDKTWHPHNLKWCSQCLLTDRFPGISFDNRGVCNVCRECETYESYLKSYFKTRDDFQQIAAEFRKNSKSEKYDCLLLFSGGKDSSYVLYQLVNMGLNVLTFTFDNGYISDTAFDNIKRITSMLKVDHIIGNAENIDRVFVESLKSDHNVCHGCWNALNAVGVAMALKHQINVVISGLSRGQIFDMRLHGLFKMGVFHEKEIEERLLLFRKTFHSRDNKFARLLDVSLDESQIEDLQFIDFFRYDDIPVTQIKKYLLDNGWIQPEDTGFCSSNCVINDAGIYMHLRDRGYHFYEAPLSWDVRLGVLNRTDGLNEIGFEGDLQHIDSILRKIGYYDPVILSDAVVLEKKSSNGDIFLCAYIVANGDIDEIQLKQFLSLHLPDYMIPQYIIQLDKIPFTTNGKLDRNSLPEPAIAYGTDIIPPRNSIDTKLRKMWAELLAFEENQISIDANFFELGGHSLNATLLVLNIQKEFRTNISLAEVFRKKTIRQLADSIREAVEVEYTPIVPVEKRHYYPLSSAQKRIFALQQVYIRSTAYNVPVFALWEGDISIDRFKKTIIELIQRHECLKTSFRLLEEEPVQYFHSIDTFDLQYFENTNPAASAKDFIRPFDLSCAPLIRVRLIKTNEQQHVLMIDMHHIITDGVSMTILLADFMSLYRGEELQPLKIQYKDFIHWSIESAERSHDQMSLQEKFWLREFETKAPELNLRFDFERKITQNLEGKHFHFHLEPEQVDALKGLATTEETSLYMVLVSICFIWLSKISGEEDVVLGSTTSGRNHADLQSIIGMFENTLALRNSVQGDFSFKTFLANVHQHTMEAFENQDYPFEELVERVSVCREKGRNPLFDFMFAFQNAENQIFDSFKNDGFSLKSYSLDNPISRFDLGLLGTEGKENLRFMVEYNTGLYKDETIDGFVRYFKDIVSGIIDDKHVQIKDIQISHGFSDADVQTHELNFYF